MKTLLAFLAIALCCSAYSQNIEHQIVASQFGAYRVPTVGNGFAFPPDSCQVSGGGKNFPAFTAGVPIKVVDASPAQIEVDTPVAVNLNNSNCSVSMTTTYQHTSFYLTSGTGGLQEALLAGQVTGGANTVILDQQWYSQVSPSTPATVIAAVKGNTSLGIVDVTTSPYTYYTWGGSAYAQVAPPGSLPSGSGIVKVAGGNGALATPGTDYVLPTGNISGTAANVSGTPTLPNGTKATTQATAPCDNSANLATDQFVVTCAFVNPLTAPGDLVVGGTGGAATRLPANANPGQAMLVSTSPTSTVVPTVKTAEAVTSGSGNTTTATWSSAPVSGESLFCSVFNSGSTATFTLTDSLLNTYIPYGSVHVGTTTSEYTQTFYTHPIANSPTTTTVTANANGSFLTLHCDSASNIAASSPTDGQQSVDVTSGQLILGTPITTTVSGDYIFCSSVANFAETLTAGPGFTAGAQSNINALSQYGLQNVAGAISPSMGTSINNAATMTCSAFKPGTAVTPASTSWNQRVLITDIQAVNTDVMPNPSFPSGGDDYANIELAINTAIQEGREFYLPPGAWKTSQELIANSNSFRMRCNSANDTYIVATASGYDTLSVGTGGITAINAGGYVTDCGFAGNGKPAVGSPTGVAALQINAMTQYVVNNVAVNDDDVGLDVIGNSFGANWHNIRGCFGGNCNVGLYLRSGQYSGSDLSFYDMWIDGAFCGVCISGGGGGYHFYSGQINAGQNTGGPNDNAGAVVLNYDYVTGDTSGSSDADFHGTSFEGTDYAWIFRNYGTNFLFSQATSMNPSSSTQSAIGVYKGTGMGATRILFNNVRLTGFFSNPQLMSFAGSTLTGPILTETSTESATQWPTINGVSTYVDNIAYQSGLQDVTVGMDQVALNSGGVWYGSTTGQPQYSTNHGSSWANFFTNPLTTLGDIPYGGANGVMTRLAGNITATDQVLVSHGQGGTPTPETYTCGAFNVGGVGNSQACTWSTSPTSGMFIACQVTNAQASTFSLTDSSGDTYIPYGPNHTLWNTGATQTFYFGPLTTTVTTTTANASAGVDLALKCQAVTNVLPVTDGQCIGDVTSAATLNCSTPAASITTTANNDYIFCAGIAASGTLSAASGFTLGSADYGVDSANQYKLQSSAGTVTPTMANSASANGSMTCSAFKSNSAEAPTLKANPALSNDSMFAGGTTFTASGCGTPTSLTGGALAGSFLAQSGTCTAVVTTGVTAPNGYACSVWDITTNADAFKQTAYNATTVTFSGTPSVGDKIAFQCTAF